MYDSGKNRKMLIENLQTPKSDMAELVQVEAESGRLNKRSRHYRVTGLMRYITVILMTICLLSVSVAGAKEHTRKVLVLNSYHRGYYWSDYVMAAIQSEFDKTELKVELFFEYMDAKRYQNDEIFPYLKELYGLKYKGVQFDVIISSDNEALVFLLAYRDLLFPGVPVVFCGVQGFQNSMLDGHDLITGVLEMYEYGSTVEIALKLHPSARQVVVITERKSTIFAYLDELTSVMSQFDREVKLVVFSLERLTMAELLEKVDALGNESIMFLVSTFRDSEGKLYSLEDSAAMIKKRCAAPIYVTGFRWLGLGPVGGRLTHGSYQGQTAAERAIRILNGESARNIPILRESPNAYMFDYIQLKHFGISLSQLPEGSIVINEPESFYYQYKTWVWMVIAVMLGLAAVVMILSANVLRRRKAEEALSNKTKALDVIITNLKQGIAYLDENDTIIYLNQQCADLFGLKYEDVFRKNVYDFHPPQKRGAVRALIKEFKEGKQYLNIVETVGNKVIDNTFHRIQDGDGNYRGILMSAVDVTVHKKAEEALIESEEKYRSVVENIGIGVSLISPKMEILALNQQLREWFPDVDVSKRPICYKTYNKPPREDICSYCPTYKSLKDGQVHESITETPAGDKIVNYRIVSSPIKDKDGKVIAAIEMVEEITERKKAEEALRESEERYKSLFQGAAEGIVVADTETKEFKYANPAVCRMLGYTEEELKRMGVCDIHPKEDLEYVISEFESQARGEKTLSPGIPCLRKDGTIMYADIDTAKVLIDGKECNVGFFTDITERKRVEEAMRESEQRFRSLVETTSDWVWEVDQDGIYTYASPKVKDLLGYEPEEIIGKAPFDLMPPDEAERVAALFKDIIASRKPFAALENTNLHKNGRHVVLETSGEPILDERGNLLGYRGIDRDITERKQAEEALRREKKRAEEYLSIAGVMLAIVNVDENITMINEKGREILGYEESELIGSNWFNTLIPKRIRGEVRGIFRKLIAGGIEPVEYYENPLLTKDGEERIIAFHNTVIRASNGQIAGTLTSGEDITERKKAEEELQKTRDELEIRVEQRTEELRSLTSELSLAEERLRRRIATDIHDHIGQNLAISKIKLESLAESMSSPELVEALEEIHNLVAQAIGSTRSLTFELSPPVLYELGFEAAMEWLVRQMRERHGLSTEFKGDGRAKPLDNDVRVLLFQAVRELLVNVAKHAKARNVTVSAQMAGDEIRVDVEDDGVGFDVSQAGSHDYKTGGFGLFSIRERLGHIGGHLNVESKRGVGTRVTLVAPIGHKEKNR